MPKKKPSSERLSLASDTLVSVRNSTSTPSKTTAEYATPRFKDTAQVYDTEVPLGNAMEKSGVPRDEIFLSTKLWMTNMHPDDIEKSVDSSLANMRTPYLDVILLHFPFSFAR